jgi:hypothetical protein
MLAEKCLRLSADRAVNKPYRPRSEALFAPAVALSDYC